MAFDYLIAYEDRDELHTSRWRLDGVSTLSTGGDTLGGWLWATITNSGDTVTVDLYKSRGTTSGDKVATGTCSKADLSVPVVCSLTAANTSGVTGELWLHSYASQPVAQVPVLVSLCVDADLAIEYANYADLPAYSATLGMADYCAAATRKTLLLCSQMFADQLGGHKAPEHRNIAPNADRELPDFRRLVNPDQLRDAAVHWALMLAFGQSHERGTATMYSELRDWHDEKRAACIAAWNPTFTAEPDDDAEATGSQSVACRRPVRL
jgi:hypothetical protein